MERQRVTQSIWLSVRQKSRCNPALVLRLSLVGLVYSGTVDLRLPPALFPSFRCCLIFSFSVNVFYAPPFLFECFFCLIVSISFDRRRAQALMVQWWSACAPVRACTRGSVVHPVRWCWFRSLVTKRGVAFMTGGKQERERESEKGVWFMNCIWLIHSCTEIKCFSAAYRLHHLITTDKL